ncbi:MAG: hypothetical protein IT377_23740 [Polyangiaceae bacterium]|nr:hypothetical protein [Polyangiaceae bacterium]
MGRVFFWAGSISVAAAFAACGGDPEFTSNPASGGAQSGGAAGAGGAAGGGGSAATGGLILDSGGDAPADADLCAGTTCAKEQHCDPKTGSCVPNDCTGLGCKPTEVCITTDGGAFCKDNTCKGDVDCPDDQHCNGTTCAKDVCTPGDEKCQGQDLLVCKPNGSGSDKKVACGGGSPYFSSQCQAGGAGKADCPCEDDWDCPKFTECDVATCEGTGVAPTCSLPPEAFSKVLPTSEISWGGTFANPQAVGSPFPASTQVVMTPLVVNLDDDTGDGVIDERDFPEIVFTSFCSSEFTSNGVLRAIHGGGSNKGKDFFANCGGTEWHEGNATMPGCQCADAELDSTAVLAAGDLDADGKPEIVGISETDGIIIYSNLGQVLSRSANFSFGGADPTPAIANVDNSGLSEIVIGRSIFTLEKDASGKLKILDRFQGALMHGINGQGPISCVANLVGDSKQELIAGTTVYRMATPPTGATKRADCKGTETGEAKTWCDGGLVVVWDGQTVNGTTALPSSNREGFCAIADVLGTDQTQPPGPNNPLDGAAEVIVVSNGRLLVLNGQSGKLAMNLDAAAGTLGGPPNVDDFDGDGFPEIGTAFAAAYVVFDLQATATECPAWTAVTDSNANKPRTAPSATCQKDTDCGNTAKFACNEATSQCVCLHNGWRRGTEDDSSRVTGSSVFDFNGDGAAEVIYNDECNFRVYDGVNGGELFKQPSESRTRIEYPIVADVDNDGNAEIVFSTSTESGFCSENKDSQYNAGIEVWGDAKDTWVSARRIWNQHAYHVTNVTENGRVPAFEPESWKPYNGRLYNSYRSNPRSSGVAPDLTVQALQVSSPDATCGKLSKKLSITVQLANVGDLRVGPGVVVAFQGTWTSVPLTEALKTSGGTPLSIVIGKNIEPGEVIWLSASYDAASNSPGVLPDKISVKVDETDTARECNETNNTLSKDVVPGAQLPDLRVIVGNPTCTPGPTPKVPTTVFNDGSAPASNVVVRYFAGDPQSGGKAVHDETLPGPIAPGASASVTATLTSFPKGVSVLVYATVDAIAAIAECNDGNNTDAADSKVSCGGVQ